MPIKVILDTNFFIECAKKRVNFFAEITADFFTIQSVVEELSAIADKKTKGAKFAAAAKNILNETKIFPDRQNPEDSASSQKSIQIFAEPEETEGDADASLFELSKKDFVIATQDRILKEKILKSGGRVMFVRANGKIEIR